MEKTTNFPLARRAKQVESREVGIDPIQIPAPEVETPGLDEAMPVVDPTAYGQRRRKRRHQDLFRLSRFLIGASFAATLAAVVCLVLADRLVANWLTSLAISLGIAAIFLSWPTRLSARVLGYAVASTVLASICFATISLLPRDIFDDHRPDAPYKDDGAKPIHRPAPAQQE